MAGFEVMHGTNGEHARKLGLRLTCGGRVDRPEQADEIARSWVGEGADGGSLHVGTRNDDRQTQTRMQQPATGPAVPSSPSIC